MLVGMPREATRSFSSALKIVAPRKTMAGWASVNVELLLARAQVLSGLGKHEACAEVCFVHSERARVCGCVLRVCFVGGSAMLLYFSPGNFTLKYTGGGEVLTTVAVW